MILYPVCNPQHELRTPLNVRSVSLPALSPLHLISSSPHRHYLAASLRHSSPLSLRLVAPPSPRPQAVIGFNSLVLETNQLSPANAECIRASLTGASALLGIITQILTYSKLSSEQAGESEAAPLACDAFSLVTLAGDVVDIVGGRAALAGVELLVTVDPDLHGAWLMGDAFRLRQIIINIADNGTGHA